MMQDEITRLNPPPALPSLLDAALPHRKKPTRKRSVIQTSVLAAGSDLSRAAILERAGQILEGPKSDELMPPPFLATQGFSTSALGSEIGSGGGLGQAGEPGWVDGLEEENAGRAQASRLTDDGTEPHEASSVSLAFPLILSSLYDTNSFFQSFSLCHHVHLLLRSPRPRPRPPTLSSSSAQAQVRPFLLLRKSSRRTGTRSDSRQRGGPLEVRRKFWRRSCSGTTRTLRHRRSLAANSNTPRLMTTHITPTTTLMTSIYEPILFFSLPRPTYERLPLQRLRDPHLPTSKSSTILLLAPPTLSTDPTRRPRSTTTTMVSSTGRVTSGSRNTCRGEKTSATTATRWTLPSID